jgi:hypothetical protein
MAGVMVVVVEVLVGPVVGGLSALGRCGVHWGYNGKKHAIT